MKAKAKAPHKKVRALTGREFVNYEWRLIPPGNEEEAGRLADAGYLELQPEEAQEVEIIDATDSAWLLAEELTVNLADVVGTGQDGRILVADVRAFVKDEEE